MDADTPSTPSPKQLGFVVSLPTHPCLRQARKEATKQSFLSVPWLWESECVDAPYEKPDEKSRKGQIILYNYEEFVGPPIAFSFSSLVPYPLGSAQARISSSQGQKKKKNVILFFPMPQPPGNLDTGIPLFRTC